MGKLCRIFLKKRIDTEAVHLRLGLEPMLPGLELSQNPDCDLNPAKTHSLPTDITHLVLGLKETQVLDVSLQKEFSERQSDR